MRQHIVRIMFFFGVLVFAGVIQSQDINADQLLNLDQGLKKVFKHMTNAKEGVMELNGQQIQTLEQQADLINFRQAHSTTVRFYEIYKAQNMLGIVYEDTVMGKWGPIHYLVGLNLDGKIQEVVILDYQEIRGRPVAKKRFLKQYRNKSIRDSIRLRQDVNGVTGATISSRSLTDGIRKIVHVDQMIRLEKL